MDANLAVMVLKCAAMVFAAGLGAWAAFIVGRYMKWAAQLSRLATRGAEHEFTASAIAVPVRSAQVFVRPYAAREQYADAALQLESVS